MKATFLIAVFVLTTFVNCLSQSEVSDSEKASLLWITELKKKDFEEQLVEIRLRLISDTSKVQPERTFMSSGTHDPICRVTLVIDGYIFEIGDYRAQVLIKNFTKSIIKSIDVLGGDYSSALYGTHAWCGAIIVTSKHKKLSKKLSQDH